MWEINQSGCASRENPDQPRHQLTRESPPKFENRIMARVYVRSISTIYLLAGTGVRKVSVVACGFSSIKIDYFDYPKSLISIKNEVYVCV